MYDGDDEKRGSKMQNKFCLLYCIHLMCGHRSLSISYSVAGFISFRWSCFLFRDARVANPDLGVRTASALRKTQKGEKNMQIQSARLDRASRKSCVIVSACQSARAAIVAQSVQDPAHRKWREMTRSQLQDHLTWTASPLGESHLCIAGTAVQSCTRYTNSRRMLAHHTDSNQGMNCIRVLIALPSAFTVRCLNDPNSNSRC